MWMPKTTNPYCDVTTYVLRDLPEQAMSLRDASGKPAIVVSGSTLADKPDYSRFLLAHECCHHSLGHMDRFKDQLGQVGPQRFFFIAPQLKQMELEADCCAVKMLRSKNDASSIEAAEGAMTSFGSDQTGAHYPTGLRAGRKHGQMRRGELMRSRLAGPLSAKLMIRQTGGASGLLPYCTRRPGT